jgi:hypothetical protein
MPCQYYKDALIEAAASGVEAHGKLLVHLDACASCRAAFEREQSFFASIDAGLRVTANAEMPASLLPSVRARLDEESAPRNSWVTNWFVLASAAVMVIAFFAARSVWSPSVTEKPFKTAEKANVQPSPNQNPSVIPAVEANSPRQHQLAIVKNHQLREAPGSLKTMPEVLVPRDQEILLAEYAEQWNLHKHPLLLAQQFDSTILPPLQVAPIQIDELDVKLLAEDKSQ